MSKHTYILFQAHVDFITPQNKKIKEEEDDFMFKRICTLIEDPIFKQTPITYF